MLSSAASAGDLLIVLEGQAADPMGFGMQTQPLAGAEAGDAVRMTISIETPGTINSPHSRYVVSKNRVQLTMGSETYTGELSELSYDLYAGNDLVSPTLSSYDYLAATVYLPSGHEIAIRVEDHFGNLFHTEDLEQQIGVYPNLASLSRIMVLDPAGLGNGLVVRLDTMEIRDMEPVGSVFCTPPATNSTGQGGQLMAYGSDRVLDNQLSLELTNLPILSIALLLVGEQQSIVMNAGGSQGDLCIAGGPIGRFNSLLTTANVSGEASFSIDLQAIPSPAGFAVVTTGQTLNFQTWYRDWNPIATSNFTNPVQVVFQ